MASPLSPVSPISPTTSGVLEAAAQLALLQDIGAERLAMASAPARPAAAAAAAQPSRRPLLISAAAPAASAPQQQPPPFLTQPLTIINRPAPAAAAAAAPLAPLAPLVPSAGPLALLIPAPAAPTTTAAGPSFALALPSTTMTDDNAKTSAEQIRRAALIAQASGARPAAAAAAAAANAQQQQQQPAFLANIVDPNRQLEEAVAAAAAVASGPATGGDVNSIRSIAIKKRKLTDQTAQDMMTAANERFLLNESVAKTQDANLKLNERLRTNDGVIANLTQQLAILQQQINGKNNEIDRLRQTSANQFQQQVLQEEASLNAREQLYEGKGTGLEKTLGPALVEAVVQRVVASDFINAREFENQYINLVSSQTSAKSQDLYDQLRDPVVKLAQYIYNSQVSPSQGQGQRKLANVIDGNTAKQLVNNVSNIVHQALL